MDKTLGCGECGGQSFTIQIEGWQENARYQQGDGGDPVFTSAETVHVTDYEPGHLRCQSCGAVQSETDLVVVDDD